MRSVVEQIVYWERITNIKHLKKQIAEAGKKSVKKQSANVSLKLVPTHLKSYQKKESILNIYKSKSLQPVHVIIHVVFLQSSVF